MKESTKALIIEGLIIAALICGGLYWYNDKYGCEENTPFFVRCVWH
jgi:hypothetical protein